MGVWDWGAVLMGRVGCSFTLPCKAGRLVHWEANGNSLCKVGPGSNEVRVAHLETGRHLYGGARQVLYLVSGLAKHHVDNVLICTSDSAIAKVPVDARVIETPMSGEADVGFLWRLRRILEAEHVDLLHVHSRRGADLYGGWAARLAGVPAIVSRRVDNTEVRVFARAKYEHYAAVIGISKAIVGVLVELGLPREKLFCVRSAVDIREYQPGGNDALRGELNLPDGAVTVGVIAQLIERKGHRHLLQAFAALKPEWPNVYIICFGQGPLLGELHAAADELQLGDRVQFVGFRNDLPALLPGLDFVVHPALAEGLGVALLEAQSAGVPIVASACGGIPEVVSHGETGLLVPPGDVDALTNAMLSLLRYPAQRASMGSAARLRIEREFSIEAMVSGNLAVYEKVLEKRNEQ